MVKATIGSSMLHLKKKVITILLIASVTSSHLKCLHVIFSFSDNEDHKPLKGSRSPSNGTVKRDDSDDSLVDYGEGGDGQFNEDGSFIGQYSGKSASRDTAEGHESSEAPSPIKAMNSLNSFV